MHDRRKSVISIHNYIWSVKVKNTTISLFKEDPMPPQRRVKLVKCLQGSTTTTTSFPSYNTRISMNYYYCCSWSWSKRNEKSKIKYLRNQLSNIWRIKYMSDQIYGRSNIKRPSLLQQWVGPGPRFVPGCNMKPLMKDKLGNTECKMLVANTMGWCKVHTHSNTHTSQTNKRKKITSKTYWANGEDKIMMDHVK